MCLALLYMCVPPCDLPLTARSTNYSACAAVLMPTPRPKKRTSRLKQLGSKQPADTPSSPTIVIDTSTAEYLTDTTLSVMDIGTPPTPLHHSAGPLISPCHKSEASSNGSARSIQGLSEQTCLGNLTSRPTHTQEVILVDDQDFLCNVQPSQCNELSNAEI